MTVRNKIDDQDLPKASIELEGTVEASYTIGIAAGSAGSNGMVVTVQLVEGDLKTNRTGVHNIRLFASNAATGIGLTTTTYSGDLVGSTGSVLFSPVAKKVWEVQTDATGKFVGTITAIAKPATEYIGAQKMRGNFVVSVVSGSNWG